MKGKEKRKGKEKETCDRASINNLALILTRVISFGVPADDPYVLQPLKRISTVDLLSCILYDKNWLQETGRHLSLVVGGRGVMTIQMATMAIIDATIFVHRSITKRGKKILKVKFSKGLLRVESPRSTTSV